MILNRSIYFENQRVDFHFLDSHTILKVYPLALTKNKYLICITIPHFNQNSCDKFWEKFLGNDEFDLYINGYYFSIKYDSKNNYNENTQLSSIFGYVDYIDDLPSVFASADDAFFWRKIEV